MKGYRLYFGKKVIWFFVTLAVAFVLNFPLPRLMPGDPVAAIVSRMAQGMSNTSGVQAIYEQYTELFGTNKSIPEQFVLYVRNALRGDFGYSISQYPRTVADVLRSSIFWTLGLQLPPSSLAGFWATRWGRWPPIAAATSTAFCCRSASSSAACPPLAWP